MITMRADSPKLKALRPRSQADSIKSRKEKEKG